MIVAVPPERAAAMLPDAALRGARWPGALGSSPIVNLHVVYDRRVLEHRFAAGVDTPVQYVFDRTPPRLERQRQYVAVSLSGADARSSAMSTAALRERYLPRSRELLPAARDARVEYFSATKEHAATFRAAPGHRGASPAGRDAAARARARRRVDGDRLAGDARGRRPQRPTRRRRGRGCSTRR